MKHLAGAGSYYLIAKNGLYPLNELAAGHVTAVENSRRVNLTKTMLGMKKPAAALAQSTMAGDKIEADILGKFPRI